MYIVESGLQALLEYLSGHVLSCLVPAFFIAGGIALFVSRTGIRILKVLESFNNM
jgi:uncharacterized membrane protein YraQ (UPF0718 family)